MVGYLKCCLFRLGAALKRSAGVGVRLAVLKSVNRMSESYGDKHSPARCKRHHAAICYSGIGVTASLIGLFARLAVFCVMPQ